MFGFRSSHAPPPISREKLREEVLERYVEIGRSVAKRFVRGNVNIKAGRFMTERDLKERKESLRELED
jgi:hypothetical protein